MPAQPQQKFKRWNNIFHLLVAPILRMRTNCVSFRSQYVQTKDFGKEGSLNFSLTCPRITTLWYVDLCGVHFVICMVFLGVYAFFAQLCTLFGPVPYLINIYLIAHSIFHSKNFLLLRECTL